MLVELALEKLLSGWRSCAKSHSQELVRSSSLHVLFVEQVEKKVLVALDEALRINLPVLQLFVSISLDPLKQCRESLLLSLSEEGLLFLNILLERLLSNLCFFLFHLCTLQLQELSFFIAFAEH